MKSFFASIACRYPYNTLCKTLFPYSVPIFMLHRFQNRTLGISGHELPYLRYVLEFLRRERFNFVSVDDIAHSISSGEPLPPKSVAFTLDDGYWDQIEASAQLFTHYDCPATFFVTTGFINGESWFWDAKIHYVFDNIATPEIQRFQQKFPDLAGRSSNKLSVIKNIIQKIKNKNIDSIDNTIALVSKEFDIGIPEKAPNKYAPTSWDRLRQLSDNGLKIGAHSHKHPILSRETEARSYQEIEISRTQLLENIPSASNVFCYPVGRSQDFGLREMGFCEKLGFSAAVSAAPFPASTKDKDALFCLPRFGLPDNLFDFYQYVSCIENLKNLVLSRKNCLPK
ncbi:polysaccharide deacetylase family protein [Teredinibacter haidensis]|uniref:polysaccharide deacetylase family protein n=1 Tax=Teredinibacter haidensis TaxID=2731755 RepID=UPI000948BB49|nr:polysaccharide deacetylase family protein [Teredinibacter haidensis]